MTVNYSLGARITDVLRSRLRSMIFPFRFSAFDVYFVSFLVAEEEQEDDAEEEEKEEERRKQLILIYNCEKAGLSGFVLKLMHI